MVEPTGRINCLGITKEEYEDLEYPGYKAKMMVSLVNSANGNLRQIQVEHHGDYTDGEKKILERIERREENLKGMQETFKDEKDTER